MKNRTKMVRVYLTKEGLKAVEDSAFKNCRTVSQELSFMIERQLKTSVSDSPSISHPKEARYDDPQAVPKENFNGTLIPSSEDSPFYEEKEKEALVLIAQSGLTEAQAKALRLICKTQDELLVQLQVEIAERNAKKVPEDFKREDKPNKKEPVPV